MVLGKRSSELKLLINWPASLFTWDLLFLIPVPWIGPVLAPVICSLTMILYAGMILFLQERTYTVKIKSGKWSFIFAGALIILGTFIFDYTKILLQEGLIYRFWKLATDEHFLEPMSHYQPKHYGWIPFILGEFLIVSALVLMFRRIKSAGKPLNERSG